jgi:hypothetical protein
MPPTRRLRHGRGRGKKSKNKGLKSDLYLLKTTTPKATLLTRDTEDVTMEDVHDTTQDEGVTMLDEDAQRINSGRVQENGMTLNDVIRVSIADMAGSSSTLLRATGNVLRWQKPQIIEPHTIPWVLESPASPIVKLPSTNSLEVEDLTMLFNETDVGFRGRRKRSWEDMEQDDKRKQGLIEAEEWLNRNPPDSEVAHTPEKKRKKVKATNDVNVIPSRDPFWQAKFDTMLMAERDPVTTMDAREVPSQEHLRLAHSIETMDSIFSVDYYA